MLKKLQTAYCLVLESSIMLQYAWFKTLRYFSQYYFMFHTNKITQFCNEWIPFLPWKKVIATFIIIISELRDIDVQ